MRKSYYEAMQAVLSLLDSVVARTVWEIKRAVSGLRQFLSIELMQLNTGNEIFIFEFRFLNLGKESVYDDRLLAKRRTDQISGITHIASQ